MRERIPRLLVVVAALAAWRVGFYHLVPWVQRASPTRRRRSSSGLWATAVLLELAVEPDLGSIPHTLGDVIGDTILTM